MPMPMPMGIPMPLPMELSLLAIQNGKSTLKIWLERPAKECGWLRDWKWWQPAIKKLFLVMFSKSGVLLKLLILSGSRIWQWVKVGHRNYSENNLSYNSWES